MFQGADTDAISAILGCMPLQYLRPPDIYIGDDIVRYALGVRGRRMLVVFGVNPSTASEEAPDQTINRVESFTSRLGYNGWLMLNLYPQRATIPGDLHLACDDALHHQNLAVIGELLEAAPGVTLCAAWGGAITTRHYLRTCLRDIDAQCRALRGPWMMLGQATQDGHPRHPSRLPLDRTLLRFDVAAYLG